MDSGGMGMASSVNVVEIIDGQPISRLQLRIAFLGALTLMLDGFDNQMIAYVAPALKSAWHLEASALGPVFSAGVTGVALGSLVIGPFGDRFGRTNVLRFTVFSFAILSLLHAFATNVYQLAFLRLVIGLVLGAVIPLVIVLCNEYAPKRHRAKMVTLVTCGYGIGNAGGGFVSIHLIPSFGWASVFYVGAVLPLLLGLALTIWMPESIRLLALRNDGARIAALLSEINPSLKFGADARFFVSTHDHGHDRSGGTFSNVRDLFLQHRAVTTLLLWACLFLNVTVLNFLNNWLPTLVVDTGLPREAALRAATALPLGGIVGIASIGMLADRFGYHRVLAGAFGLGGIVIAMIGSTGSWLPGLVISIFFAGFAVIGSQMTLGAFSATLYPTRIRATGSSWAFGVGRLLSIMGPLLGGVMIGRRWPMQDIFYCAALPMFLAMFAITSMMRVRKSSAGETTEAPQPDAALR
jgi:MFS transporter, AAHS family, 4-hydroxybenzoate transporter